MNNNNSNRTSYNINYITILKNIVTLIILISLILLLVNIVRFPELYLPTWKYQLKNDVAKGDQAAITYYNSTYMLNGKTLFSDN